MKLSQNISRNKKYADTSKKEQSVVDSFEGKKSYTDTLNKSHFYLAPIEPNVEILIQEECRIC